MTPDQFEQAQPLIKDLEATRSIIKWMANATPESTEFFIASKQDCTSKPRKIFDGAEATEEEMNSVFEIIFKTVMAREKNLVTELGQI